MIGRGAQVFPDEIEPITAYLAASAGRGRPQASSAAWSRSRGQPFCRGAASNATTSRRATTKPASEEWPAVIDRMIRLGAALTPAEQQTLLAYLTGLKK